MEAVLAMHQDVPACVENSGHGLDDVAELVGPAVAHRVHVPLVPLAASGHPATQEVDEQVDLVVVDPLLEPVEGAAGPQLRPMLQLRDERRRRSHGTDCRDREDGKDCSLCGGLGKNGFGCGYTCLHAYMYVDIYVYICVYMDVYIYAYMYIYVCISVHTHIRDPASGVRRRRCCRRRRRPPAWRRGGGGSPSVQSVIYLFIYIYIYIHMYIYMHVYKHACMCMHVCMYVCRYVCTLVSLYIHIYKSISILIH